MHLECAIVDTDDLVSKDRQVWIILGAMHSDRQLRRVAILLSSYFHVATLDKDIVAIKRPLVIRVSVRREDQTAFNVDEGKDWGAINVEEEVETLGDIDSFAFLRGKIVAPSLILRPQADVANNLVLGGDKSKAINVNLKPGFVRSVRLVRSGANDCVFSL